MTTELSCYQHLYYCADDEVSTVVDSVLDVVRKEAEGCDMLQFVKTSALTRANELTIVIFTEVSNLHIPLVAVLDLVWAPC